MKTGNFEWTDDTHTAVRFVECEGGKETIMDLDEINKCIKSPLYFYNKYVMVNGEHVAPLTQEQWDELMVAQELIRQGYVIKRGPHRSDLFRWPNHIDDMKES
jgi:hypothetical protein